MNSLNAKGPNYFNCIELFQEGHRPGAIAKTLGLTRARVHQHLQAAGLECRQNKLRELYSFVVVWEGAESIDEVAKTLNMRRDVVKTQASRLRRKGLELKFFRAGEVDRDPIIAMLEGGTKTSEICSITGVSPQTINRIKRENIRWKKYSVCSSAA